MSAKIATKMSAEISSQNSTKLFAKWNDTLHFTMKDKFHNLREFALCILTSSGKHARLVWFVRGLLTPLPPSAGGVPQLGPLNIAFSSFNLPKNRSKNCPKIILPPAFRLKIPFQHLNQTSDQKWSPGRPTPSFLQEIRKFR